MMPFCVNSSTMIKGRFPLKKLFLFIKLFNLNLRFLADIFRNRSWYSSYFTSSNRSLQAISILFKIKLTSKSWSWKNLLNESINSKITYIFLWETQIVLCLFSFQSEKLKKYKSPTFFKIAFYIHLWMGLCWKLRTKHNISNWLAISENA